MVGGLVGANGGTITGSTSFGAVYGGSDSFLGGLVGVNLGLITQSSTQGFSPPDNLAYLSSAIDTTPYSYSFNPTVTGGANTVTGNSLV